MFFPKAVSGASRDYLVRRDAQHQIYYHLNNICTFKRVGKTYAYLAINCKHINGNINFTKSLVTEIPCNWSSKIYGRSRTEIYCALSLKFPMHLPQRSRRFCLTPQSEPGSSVIVQNGARVCDVANICGICLFLKDIGRHFMTENLHFYYLISYFVTRWKLNNLSISICF